MIRLTLTLIILANLSPVFSQIQYYKEFNQDYLKVFKIDTIKPRPKILMKTNNDTTVENNLQHDSDIKTYDISFILESEGYFINNRKQQAWKYYNVANSIKSIGYSLSKEIFKGDSAAFHKHYYKGSLIKEVDYINDTIDGDFKSYYRNGNLKSIIHYKKGEIIDSVVCYYENGKVFFSGTLITGTVYYKGTEFFETGKARIVKQYNVDYILSEWANK